MKVEGRSGVTTYLERGNELNTCNCEISKQIWLKAKYNCYNGMKTSEGILE